MDTQRTQYWVVGGEFSDTGFTDLVNGSGEIMGPYIDRAEAERAWSEVATETRSSCCTRYSIAEERLR